MFDAGPRSTELLERLERFIVERVDPAADAVDAERAARPDVQPPTVERLKTEARDLDLWNLNVRAADCAGGRRSGGTRGPTNRSSSPDASS